MSDINLILGDFTFQDMEIPEVIGFGGDQRLSIKKLVGGGRVIDAVGKDRRPVQWSGIFLPTPDGQSALDRARTVQRMQDAALPLTLSWDEVYLSVIIRSFEPDYRFARIPYRITCEVIVDLTELNISQSQRDADDLVNDDLNSANTLTAATGDGALSGLMSTVSSAVASVKTFVGAALSEVAPVLQAVHQAQAYITTSIASVDNVLASVGVPGGVLPSVPILQSVTSLGAIAGATGLQVQYTQIGSLLGRMSTNLSQINSSGRSVTVGGGNLFDMASSEYGDATGWETISNANPDLGGDPQISGIQTVTVPPAPPGMVAENTGNGEAWTSTAISFDGNVAHGDGTTNFFPVK